MTTPPRHFGRSLKPFHYPRAWMVLWILAIAIVVAGELLPGKDLPSLSMSDKSEHFIAYALLSATGLGRSMDRYDALANTIGVLIGLATAFTPLRDLLLWVDRRLSSRN